MAKSEILMWVAGILMMIILGLAVAPTITKSGDTAKNAVGISEVNNLKQAVTLWYADNAANAIFCNATPTNLKPYIDSLNYDGSKFVSKAKTNIKFDTGCDPSYQTEFLVTISGLDNETQQSIYNNLKETQSDLSKTAYTTINTSGTGSLLFSFKI